MTAIHLTNSGIVWCVPIRIVVIADPEKSGLSPMYVRVGPVKSMPTFREMVFTPV